MRIKSEEDFKVKTLSDWGFHSKEYILNEDRVDIKLKNIWIEVKQKHEDIYEMLAQLIFTAYKVHNNKTLPSYFGCFNNEKGGIIESHQVFEVFTHTDVNWNQTPSKLDKKTIERIKFLIKDVQEYKLEELGEKFKEIQTTSVLDIEKINKNNFITVYYDWLEAIGNRLDLLFEDDIVTKSDCYLADLMSNGTETISDKLEVAISKTATGKVSYLKKRGQYFLPIEIRNQERYRNFWSRYHRPPAEEYQDYILSRRDLLQENNFREEKGAFFTPKIWCDVSKEYLADVFGENWQDEYYIWDCACGTGNLMQGLVRRDRIFMSTLDEADIKIMNQLNIFKDDVVKFQFDFLNDDWKPKSQKGKIPDILWQILQNEPNKVIIYINPPYLEAGNNKQKKNSKYNRKNKTLTKIKQAMNQDGLGEASNELFAQFYYRAFKEIKGCKIGSFSTLKNCVAPNFEKFRDKLNGKFCKGFVCRANTFDNVSGQFPISFQIWNYEIEKKIPKVFKFDIFERIVINGDEVNAKANKIGRKKIYNFKRSSLLNNWFKSNNSEEQILGYAVKHSNDFQQQKVLAIYSDKRSCHLNRITKSNLIQSLIYVAVRLCINATWLNDRDQFTMPYKIKKTKDKNEILQKIDKNEKIYEYENDEDFIGNCIVFALFEKNFTDWEIFPNSQINGDGLIERDLTIYNLLLRNRVFTKDAQDVLETAKNIYKLYNKIYGNPKASWHKVNKTLKDDENNEYTHLKEEFIYCQNILAMEVASDVYKYGFLEM